MGSYSNLLADIPDFLETRESTILGKLDRIMELAVRRIALEVPITALHREDVGTMTAGDPIIPRPTNAIVYRYLTYQRASAGSGNPIKSRPVDFIRYYWPDPSLGGQPKYYADFDKTRVILAPTPDDAYSYRFGYRLLPAFLGAGVEDNEFSALYYDVLLAASLATAARFLLDDRRQSAIDRWEAEYARGRAAIEANETGRVRDAGNTQPPEAGN